jgi:hypothetical protein
MRHALLTACGQAANDPTSAEAGVFRWGAAILLIKAGRIRADSNRALVLDLNARLSQARRSILLILTND